MPTFQIVFSSVADIYIEADDLKEAEQIASNYPADELDWISNTAIESIEEVEE